MQQQATQFQATEFDFLLLLNIPVPIVTEYGELINVKTPSLETYYTNTPYRRLEALLLIDLEEDVINNPEQVGFIADTLSDVLIGIAISGTDAEILEAFEKVSGCQVKKDGISFNGVEITEQDVLEIRAALLIATGHMEISGELTKKEEEEDEFDKRLREMEERINKIKKETETENKVTFSEMVLFIIYELGSSAEEIKKLNVYGIREMYNFASRVSADKIQKIAAGNGNLGEKNPYKGILSDK